MANTPLILLPGLLCNETVWPAQQAGLADLAPSQVIDYGMIDSLPAMAAHVLAQSPARFSLAGHSMGGRIAMEIMRQAPERVTALALFDTAFHPLPAGEAGKTETTQRHLLLGLARTRGMRAAGWQWLQTMIHESRLGDKALVEAILTMIEAKTPDQFAAQITALLNRPDAEPVLPTIRCPTLVLCGREDRFSPLALHERMAELIPASRLVVIETCGHMSTMEQPAAVTAAMRRWLTDAIP